LVAGAAPDDVLAEEAGDALGAGVPEDDFLVAVEEIDSRRELFENGAPDVRASELERSSTHARKYRLERRGR